MKFKINKVCIILPLVFLFSLLYMAKQAISLGNVDYIWNYGFSAKISLGLIPYRDFNLLQTPFSFYFSGLFLNIFGNYIYIHIIVGAFVLALMYYLLYCVLLKINNNEKFSFCILLITLVYTFVNLTFYSYNILAVAFILCIILLELKNRVEIKNNIIIGLLLGLVFMTKQNIGAVTAFMMTANILFSQCLLSKKIRIIFIRGGVSLLLVLAYSLYLYKNNALYDFVDHAFLGIIDFSNENKYVESYAVFLFLLIPFFIFFKAIVLLFKYNRFALDDSLFIVLSYSFAGLLILYPMVDFQHSSVAIVIPFLLVSYIYTPEQIVSNKLITLCFLIILGCFLGLVNSFFSEKDKLFSEEKYYKNMIVSDELINHFSDISQRVNDYKKAGHDVIILDTTAMAYQFDMGRYNDRFDFLIQGNVGYKGTEKYLNKFKSLDNGSLFLVGKMKKVFGITALNIFVICNYEFVEDIGSFYIYRKIDVDEYKYSCSSARELISS